MTADQAAAGPTLNIALLSGTARLIIVDQSLKDFLGHYAEYTLSVAVEAAKTVPVIILANQSRTVSAPDGIEIVPTFRFTLAQPQRSPPPPDYDAAVSFAGWSFLADLRRGLERVNVTAADHVFIHSIGFREIEDLLALALTADRARLPVLDVLLRRDLDEIDDRARRRFVAYLRAFAHLGLWPDRVRFFSDTEALSGHYAQATGIPFGTLPIPFNQRALAAALAARQPQPVGRPLLVGYLGDARLEKGYQFLPNLVSRLMHSHLLSGKARLRIQSNYNRSGGERGIAEARQALERFSSDLVELIYEPIDEEEYYRCLAELDVAVLPYLAARYSRRSSGIFAQAVAAGKVVVIASGTQMAAEARRGNRGGCVFYDRPEELHAAVVRALDNYDSLAPAAAAAAAGWRAQNSVEGVLAKLLRTDPEFPPEVLLRYRRPLVLHVVDGEAAFSRTGSAVVQDAQQRFLEAAGYRVATVQLVNSCPAGAELTAWIDRSYAYWLATGTGFCWLAYYLHPPEAAPPGLDSELANAELYSVPDTLKGLIASHAVDFVVTNHAATAPFLDTLGLLGQVPVICQAHEIRSFHYAIERGRRVDEAELRRELATLGRMDMVLAVSAVEGRLIADTLGADRVVAATPPNFAEPLSIEDMAGVQDLAELVDSARGEVAAAQARNRAGSPFEALAGATGIDLLFVSNAQPQGMASLDWFLDEVYGPQLARHGITLLLAGPLSATEGAAERQRRFPASFFLAGRVATLRPLYAAAKIVILPIVEGAGLDIETIEALSFGKPVVATSRALRGIATMGEPLSAFDDAAAFAARIVELLGDASLRREEAVRNWRASAGQRDVAAYFATLSRVFGRLLGEAPPTAEPIRPADFEFVEWGNEDTQLLNRFARAVAERSASIAELVEPVADSLAVPGTAGRLYRILASLSVRATAPILRAPPQIASALPEASGGSVVDGISSLYLRAFLPARIGRAGPRLLAGCQHLGDVLRACGIDEPGDDGATTALSGVDVTVLLPDRRGHPQRAALEAFLAFYDDCFCRHLAAKGATLTVVGELGLRLQSPGVLQVGTVADPAPILAATRVIVAPWSEAAVLDPAVFATMLEALAVGKPLVASLPSLWFLGGAERARFAFATLDECADMVRNLLDDAAGRLAAAERTADLARRMLAGQAEWDSRQHEMRRIAQLTGSDIRFAEWGIWLAWCGRIIRKVAHGVPILAPELATLEGEFADPAVLPVWEEMIEAVFVRGDAPLRESAGGPLAGDAKSHWPRIRGADDFLFECRVLSSAAAREATSVVWAPPQNSDPRGAETGLAPPPDPLAAREGQPFQLDLSRPISGSGWYPAEQSAWGRFRWTGPRPAFTLDVPLSPEYAYRCEMAMIPVRPRAFDGFSVTVNDSDANFDHRLDGNTIRLSFDIPAVPQGAGLCRIAFRHRSVFSPAEDGGSKDTRRLGFAVRSISFRPLAGNRALAASDAEAAES